MPSLDVIDILPDWLQKTGETLTAFHVLCKVCSVLQSISIRLTSQATSLITDSALEKLGHYMTQLKHLHIAGCPKVTHKGILSILHNTQRIESLGLEGLSSAFVSSRYPLNIGTQFPAVAVLLVTNLEHFSLDRQCSPVHILDITDTYLTVKYFP